MFYVYAYLDIRKPGNYDYNGYKFNHEPFYIGKGKNNRMKEHLKEERTSNPKKNNKIQKMLREGYQPIITKLKEFIIEKDAFEYEKELIKNIGRWELGGPLTNMTDGGEGVSGFKMPKEVVEKMSERKKELWMDENFREKNSKLNATRVRRKEVREKIRKANIGKKHTEQTKEKMRQTHSKRDKTVSLGVRKKLSEMQMGEKNSMAGDKWIRSEEGMRSFKEKTSGEKNHRSKKWKITSPENKVYEIVGGLGEFCNNVIGGIHYMVLIRAMRKGRGVTKGKYKGWRLEEL